MSAPHAGDDAASLYARRGFGARQGIGSRPCLLIVDFSYGFTDPSSPLYCDADAALAVTADLLRSVRSARLPVVFTTVEYDAADRVTARLFLAKAPALASLEVGSHWSQIDARVAPEPGERVIKKLWASAFFATPLAAMLTGHGCDGVILAGASTSGCVRATAVDAVQHGYHVTVVGDAVADRAPSAHEASLADLDAKYADVMAADAVCAAIADLPAAHG